MWVSQKEGHLLGGDDFFILPYLKHLPYWAHLPIEGRRRDYRSKKIHVTCRHILLFPLSLSPFIFFFPLRYLTNLGIEGFPLVPPPVSVTPIVFHYFPGGPLPIQLFRKMNQHNIRKENLKKNMIFFPCHPEPLETKSEVYKNLKTICVIVLPCLPLNVVYIDIIYIYKDLQVQLL